MPHEHEIDRLARNPRPALATERLVLRAPRAADAPVVARLANDRAVADMLAHVPHPYDEDDAADFVVVAESSLVFAVTRRSDGAVLGVCGLRATERAGVADLGYWLGRAHWGQGVATEAVQAVLDLAFAGGDVDCVVAGCRAINNRSRRVLEKCGFQFRGTGTFVSLAAGRVASEHFALDRRNWTALKNWGRLREVRA